MTPKKNAKEVNKMLRVSHSVCVFVAAMLMVPAALHAKDVVVYMSNGRIVNGELLVVGDTSLLLGSIKLPGEEGMLYRMSIPFDSIWQVEVEGGSKMWAGAFVGFLAGAAVGAATAGPPGGILGDMTAPMAIMGGSLGALVGGGVGSLITTDDIWVNAGSPGGFSVLRKYARYDTEQDYLNRRRWGRSD